MFLFYVSMCVVVFVPSFRFFFLSFAPPVHRGVNILFHFYYKLGSNFPFSRCPLFTEGFFYLLYYVYLPIFLFSVCMFFSFYFRLLSFIVLTLARV